MSPSTDPTSAPPDPLLQQLLDKFAQASACWYSSVRRGNRSHLAPIWHVWCADTIYVITRTQAVRTQNLQHSTSVSLALPDTNNVLIIEGSASIAQEVPAELYPLFQTKYNWDAHSDTEYAIIIRIVPSKVLAWGEHGSGRWIFDQTNLAWSKLP